METRKLFVDFTLFHFDISVAQLILFIYLFLSKTTIIVILSVVWLQMKQTHSVDQY